MAGSSLTYRILGDPSSAVRAMREVRGEVDKQTKGMRESFKALAGLSAGIGVADFLKGSLDEARESQKVGAQTIAVLKSTHGAAKITADQIGDLAGQVSKYAGIDDEAIQAGENLLLTFKNIRNEAGKGNDVFNQATKIMVDLGVAMGTDPKTSAIQLGKALNDPIKGITALTRVGVTFTQQQKDQITALVQSGKTLDAQKIILRELNSEFGGSAAAQATAADKAKVAWGNLQEQVGTAVIPALDSIANILSDDVIPAFSATFGFIQKHQTEVKVLAGTVLGLWGAYKGYTVLRTVTTWLGTAGARYRQFIAELSYGNRAQRAASSGLQGLAAGAKSLSVLGGAAVAVTALGYGINKLIDGGKQGFSTMQHLGDIAKDYRDELIATNGAINDRIRLSVGAQLQDKGIADKAAAAGISLRDLENAVTGNDKAMASLITRWKASGSPSDDTTAAVKFMHIAFRAASSGAKDLAGSTDAATKKTDTWADEQRQTAAAVAAANKRIADQKEKIDELIDATLKLTGNRVSAARAQLQFRDGLASATEQVKENGKGLDASTAKGRANQQWLLDQLSAINDVADAQRAAGGSLTVVGRQWLQNEQALKDAAAAAGLNKTQVDNLIGSLDRATRRKFKIQLDADIAAAKQAAQNYKTYLREQQFIINVQGRVSLRSGVHVAGFASGTKSALPGWKWVGERGPELLRFRGGEQVLSHPESMRATRGYADGTITAAQLAGGVNVNVYIDGQQFRGMIRSEINGDADHQATLGRMRSPS